MKSQKKSQSKTEQTVKFKVTDNGVVSTTSSEILRTSRAKAQLDKFSTIVPTAPI